MHFTSGRLVPEHITDFRSEVLVNQSSDPALLVIDVQQGLDDVSRTRNNPHAEQRIADLLAAWRTAGKPVIHVQHMSTEPQCSVVRPTITSDSIPLDRKYFSRSVPMKALLTFFWKRGSPAIGSASFLIALPGRGPALDGTSPVMIFVYVSDVDRTIELAIQRGAKVILPAKNQFWGDRSAVIMDPGGHVWTVASRVEETTVEERADRWSRILRERKPD
jgi:predicted enzyme related to lactoylglutathione lyase